jgi:aspartyl-tRNA(Asn)/glutamyl-tRNA(Gln) amidotransferase subunit A
MEINSSALTISSALTSLRAGQFSALELTEACLRQIEHLNPIINAFITPTLELAYQAALQADTLHSMHASNLKELTLLGIPIALKDLIETSGVTTTAGSKFFIENIPGQDAEVALRLKLAGAVILGKTNTHEIALGVTGINPHFGAVKNPWDHSRISGGSSSGSAAAVATGMCLAALGTDTGGSIRIPASLCGLVGLKPTYGRVSARGVIPLSWNLDHVGTLSHTVRDAALLLQVLAGYDPHDPVSENVPVDDYLGNLDEGVKTWRVAMAMGEYVEESNPDVLTGLQNASLVFKNMGAHVEKVDLSWIADLATSNSRITQADAAAYHHQRLIEHPDWFGADVLQRLQAGAALSSSEYALARRMQSESHRSFEMFFGKYDLLILPTTPIPAPPIEGTAAIEAARQLTRFTAPFNLTGLPALSVPCGFSEGLPFGIQMVSQPWSEARLLQAGSAFEKADPWHENQFRLRAQ